MPYVCGDEPQAEAQQSGICTVYPTYVGMNRIEQSALTTASCIPHVCGDEPATIDYEDLDINVYPTYVGMNRQTPCRSPSPGGIPHVCGDEPQTLIVAHALDGYTPRMWG